MSNRDSKPRKVIGYLCQIAWDHELGEDRFGTIIYPSLKAYKADHKTGCKAVKVEISIAPAPKRRRKKA